MLMLRRKKTTAPVASNESAPLGRLRIPPAGGPLEREADRVADEMMANGTAKREWSLSGASAVASLQRKCACGGSGGATGECEECKEKEKQTLQRKASGAAQPGVAPPIVREVLNSPGQPLDNATRDFFEPRFGHDFSKVRVHADSEAARAATAVSSLAYTVGGDVVFGGGLYNSNSNAGRQLLAHELAHVVQQGTTTSRSGSLPVSWPVDTDEQAADGMAAAVASGRSVPAVAAVAPPVLQRQQASTGLAGSSSQPGSGEARLIASFDVDPGTKRPWNLNQLTKAIVDALLASELAYVRILGVYPTKTNEDDPQGEAYGRADLVRRALIQWIGPKKFSEDRFDVAFASGSIGDPQVQVEIAYKGRVLSEPRTPLPTPAPPKLPPSSTLSPTAPAPQSLIPSQPYPGQASNVFSAFLETPMGKRFKDAALVELKRVWKKTSTGEKVAILVHLLAILGAATYGLATMSPSQQKGILDVIVGDEDKFLQAPLPEKELPGLPISIPF